MNGLRTILARSRHVGGGIYQATATPTEEGLTTVVDESDEQKGVMLRPSRDFLRSLSNTPWAVAPAVMPEVVRQVSAAAEGYRVSAEEMREVLAGARGPIAADRKGAVAVVSLQGLLGVPTLMSFFFGDPLDRFVASFRAALADPGIQGIVIAIDSPGGSVYGIAEAAAEVRAARGQKKVVAFADPIAASAAYWIASQADEIVVTPSGEVGSIGVLSVHQDFSKAMEAAGVTSTIISAGRFKADGTDLQPLSDEARAAIQAKVDDYYAMFVKAVAAGRGTNSQAVKNGYGEGRVVLAADAVKAGLADRVGTLETAVSRAARSAASAEVVVPGITAADVHDAFSDPEARERLQQALAASGEGRLLTAQDLIAAFEKGGGAPAPTSSITVPMETAGFQHEALQAVLENPEFHREVAGLMAAFLTGTRAKPTDPPAETAAEDSETPPQAKTPGADETSDEAKHDQLDAWSRQIGLWEATAPKEV